MVDYLFPIVSALIWAGTVPILRLGISQCDSARPIANTLFGLLISLAAGSVVILLLSPPEIAFTPDTPWIASAGVLTFSVGTGLYYLCGYGMKGRLDLAAQFTRVKPIVSISLAIFVLGERLNGITCLVIVLVCIGTLLLLRETIKSGRNIGAFLTGLATAAAWAGGEVCAKVGFPKGLGLEQSAVALISGTLFSVVVLLPLILKQVSWVAVRRSAVYFAAHGALSFGIGYPLFFSSIANIGVTHTICITAFWPLASIFLVHHLSKVSPATFSTTKPDSGTVLAGLVLVSASILGAVL